MNIVKTPQDIKKLNFNDLAFFLEISVTDAKWKILESLNLPLEEKEKLINDKSGNPKIRISDLVSKNDFEFKIKSCSHLEGENHIDYHIKTFNKGVPKSKLQQYSEAKGFVAALRFTGKSTILNEILNKEQLLTLQKHWVLKNTYNVKRWSKKCIDFIENNSWCIDFLSGFISIESELEVQKQLLDQE